MAFAAGLWAGRYVWRPPSWWVIAAFVFSASATYFLRRRTLASSVLVFGAIFAAGALTIQIRGPRAGEPHPWFGNGEEVLVTAHVTAEGNLQSDGPGPLRQRIDVETEKIESNSESRETRAGVRLNIYSQTDRSNSAQESGTSMQLFHYGQRIRFQATLNLPRNFRNPGAFDYAGYLRENGIAVTASAKYANIEELPGFSGSRVELWRARFHRGAAGADSGNKPGGWTSDRIWIP